jgi:PIN domain
MIALLDTNVLLHYDFHGANWSRVLGKGAHLIVTCWVNVQELDRLKNDHPKQRRRDRSRNVLKIIEEASTSPLRLPSSSDSEHLLTFSSPRPDIDFAEVGLDGSIPDHPWSRPRLPSAMRIQKIPLC